MKIIFVTIVVAISVCAYLVRGEDDGFNIDVKQQNAEVYHEQSSKNNEFNYGYQVEKVNSQFQHKAKGPDDVTYGCYGFIDPSNEKHLVYYVADRLGYRLVAPNQPTKIFTERVANSINKLNNDLTDKKLDERVVAWNDLYLPDSCRRLNEILTISTPAPKTTNGGKFRANQINLTVTTLAPKVSNGGPFGGNQLNLTTTTSAPKINEGGLFGGKQLNLTTSDTNVQPLNELPLQSTTRPTTVTAQPSITSKQPLTQTTSRPTEASTQATFTLGPIVPIEPVTTYRPPVTTTQPLKNLTPSATNAPAVTPFVPIYSSTNSEGNIRTSTRITPVYPTVPSTPNPDGYTYPVPTGPTLKADCNHRDSTESPSLGPYNGYVYPIHGDCSTSELNVQHLMTQMEALNQQVLELSANIRALQGKNLTSSSGGDTCCRSWLERQRSPLIVYVPIILPYLGIDLPGKKYPNSINPASYAFQKMCEDCK